MADFRIVLLKILAMFLVMLLGWYARHRGFLTTESTSTLSRFVVELAMPALILTQMLRTVDPATLRADWYLPLLGGAILIFGQGVGLFTLPFFARQAAQRPTFIFLVAVANWVYLPLPIAEALYGTAGIRTILLFNVGAQLVLWTLGVWTLRGGKPDWASLRELARNPGMITTAVGILLALFVPASRTLETLAPSHAAPGMLLAAAIVQALAMLGALTIPLSLVTIGAQLGQLDLSDHRPSRMLTGVLGARLLLAPLLTVALTLAIARLGYTLPAVPRMCAYLVAAMPVAVSCSMFTETYGGDTLLAARAIFYSTLLSIFTVPVLFYVIQHSGF